MKNYFFLIGLIVLLGCTQKRQIPPYLLVELDKPDVSSIHLQYLTSHFEAFDTAVVTKNGLWEFTTDSVPAGFYQLVVDGQPRLRLVLSDGAPARIAIKGTNSPVRIVGSAEAKALQEIEIQVAQLSTEIRTVTAAFSDSLPTDRFYHVKDSLLDQITHLKANCRTKLEDLYRSHSQSLVQLAILYQQAGNHSLFDPLQDASFYYSTDSVLMQRYPDYQPVVDFHQRVDSLRQLKRMVDRTSAGNKMPVFELPNAWGEKISYAGYQDRNTLIVTWSSTSEACRQATRDLWHLTRTLRQHGLAIVMISLDTDASAWKKAIRDDRLPFVHLADLEGMASPIVNQLGITHQPLFWVVDSAGIIQKRTTEVTEALNALSLIMKN